MTLNNNVLRGISVVMMVMLLSIVGCNKIDPNDGTESKFELSPQEYSAMLDGGAFSIEVVSSGKWTAASDQSWCDVRVPAGDGNGTIRGNIKINSGKEARVAKITVTNYDGVKKDVTVTQAAKVDKRAQDSLALVDIYLGIGEGSSVSDTMDYPGKPITAAWDPKKPFSTWQGVSTDVIEGEVRVTGLNLTLALDPWDGSIWRVDYPFPKSVGNMSELRSLKLDGAHIRSTLPDEIGNLTKLQILTMVENFFTGPLPASIGHLKSLSKLNIQSNYFSGDLPAEIGQLTKLTYLDLGYNCFSKMPEVFGNLTELEYLDLSNQLSVTENGGMIEYPIERPFPQSVMSLTKLRTFAINYANVVGPLPTDFSGMSNLETLSMRTNQITGPIPSSIFKIKTLRELNLMDNKMSGEIPANISDCASLYKLFLANNQLTGTLPASFGDIRLNILDLQNNKLSGTIATSTFQKRDSTLQYLYLNDNAFEGVFTAVDVMPNVIDFNISNNKFTGTGDFTTMKSVRSLVLSNNLFTTVPTGIGAKQRQCDYLDLRDNNIGGTLPLALADMLVIKVLLLSGNKFVGEIPSQYLNHMFAYAFYFKYNICPQQTGYGFTNCPADPFEKPAGDPNVGDGGILLTRRR